MIEPTAEMIDAFWAGHDDAEDGGTERGLAAVLTLVERDYGVERRCPHGHPGGRRCGPCSFDAIERDHEEREEWAAMVAAEREDDAP